MPDLIRLSLDPPSGGRDLILSNWLKLILGRLKLILSRMELIQDRSSSAATPEIVMPDHMMGGGGSDFRHHYDHPASRFARGGVQTSDF